MNERNKILEQFKKKIANLRKHNKLYFVKDKPEISDSEYDNLKNEIIELEKKYPFVKKDGSVDLIVGAPPSNKFKKIKHLIPMLSLSNAFNQGDIEDFLKKINNFLNFGDKKIELFSEPKIDGISATLIYKNGQLKN